MYLNDSDGGITNACIMIIYQEKDPGSEMQGGK